MIELNPFSEASHACLFDWSKDRSILCINTRGWWVKRAFERWSERLGRPGQGDIGVWKSFYLIWFDSIDRNPGEWTVRASDCNETTQRWHRSTHSRDSFLLRESIRNTFLWFPFLAYLSLFILSVPEALFPCLPSMSACLYSSLLSLCFLSFFRVLCACTLWLKQEIPGSSSASEEGR